METRSKIAFLCHPYHRGGVTRWMADATITCARQGHEVYFVTVAPSCEFLSARGRETLLQMIAEEPTGINIVSTSVGHSFEFGTQAYRAWIYKKLLLKLPAGTPIVLADDEALWEAAAALHTAYPLIGVIHADEEYYYKLAEKYAVRVDLFSCVSNRVRENTRKRIPEFSASAIVTIPCGIRMPAERRAGPPNMMLQLIFVGRISEYQKRAGDLLKIAARLKELGVAFHLTIAGDGTEKTELEQLSMSQGMGDIVSFPGWLSRHEVADHLAKSDILLLTSDFEGTPIAMMEAFAAGCGMVGTRVSGIEDYERHPLAGNCLGIYSVGDINEATEKIMAVAAIPADQRSKAAREMAVTEFSMEVCLSRYFAAMEMLKTAGNRPGKIDFPVGQLLYSKLIALARYTKLVLGRKTA